MTLEVALMPFVDRIDAGRRLADRLGSVPGDVVVLALPKGGVPVAVEVARALDAPLDVILVRKLGVPVQPELAMGAIGEGGIQIANEDVIRAARITDDQWTAVVDREAAELERRAQRYRGDRQPEPLAGRIAVLVDDGIATGATATAACQVAHARGAARIVLAVPVASPRTLEALRSAVDEIVCLETPTAFRAVGEWYDDFSQTTDDEVATRLATGRGPSGGGASGAAKSSVAEGGSEPPAVG